MPSLKTHPESKPRPPRALVCVADPAVGVTPLLAAHPAIASAATPATIPANSEYLCIERINLAFKRGQAGPSQSAESYFLAREPLPPPPYRPSVASQSSGFTGSHSMFKAYPVTRL